jgi:hypothetical protein
VNGDPRHAALAGEGVDASRIVAGACGLAAVLVGVGFAAMLTPSLSPIRGAAQRVAEAGVFAWIAGGSIALLRRTS